MNRALMLLLILCVTFPCRAAAEEAQPKTDPPTKPSDYTEECLACHGLFSPGIVSDWQASRHARTSLQKALLKPKKERRVSLRALEGSGLAATTSIGCAECHTQFPDKHADTFDHHGYDVHVVVSPLDCSRCHPVEAEQYRTQNKMAHAYGNLKNNPLYHQLSETIIGKKNLAGSRVTSTASTLYTQMDSCYGCHGTRIEVLGMQEIESPLEAMQVPLLKGWPNMGVGRVNPDGTLGSCTACHTRHAFSLEAARHPHVCSQCHLKPDAPAWDVYRESKHGNLYATWNQKWDFDAVPWRVGTDFHAPTCAACHASLVVDQEGAVVAQRTHGFSARLWKRLFGLIYSHPQPIDPDTSTIRNSEGLPLPTTFNGETAQGQLIPAAEQVKRKRNMITLCQGCHSTQWANGHFDKMEGSLADVDEAVGVATQLMSKVWDKKIANRENPFDEPAEMLWIEAWLFYANSIRYTSAMAGTPDYAAFHYGWWDLTKTIRELETVLNGK